MSNFTYTACWLLTCTAALAQTTFSDDFNRSDSAYVGNGWQDATNASGTRLGIVAGTLSAVSATRCAVFRPFAPAGGIQLSATATDENGYYCGSFRLRYQTSFAIRNDGTLNGGYMLQLSRTDQNYANSAVYLYDNGSSVGFTNCPFQFGTSVSLDYVNFSDDGSVVGHLTSGTNGFSFSFPPRSIISQGTNLLVAIDGWGNCGSSGVIPTVDNFQVTTVNQGPLIFAQPPSQTAQANSTVTFNVVASGPQPLSFQWSFSGQALVGETQATLSLNSVSAAQSGNYSVVVSNPCGSVTSQPAYLSVLTDGANGTQPEQIAPPSAPQQPAGTDSLVLVTHGWEPGQPLANIAWVNEMAAAIQSRSPQNYIVVPFHWESFASYPDPDMTIISGSTVGSLYAKLRLTSQNWKHVHLIGHSAGSAVIEAIAKQLASLPNPPTIHETFLDPYTSFLSLSGRSAYGANADWADNYSARGMAIDVLANALGFGNSTVGKLDHAYNTDVGWADPNGYSIPFGNGRIAFASHSWPVQFYMQTVTNQDPQWCGKSYGFPLSKEDGGWTENASTFPVGLDPYVICGPQNGVQNQGQQPTYNQVFFDDVAHAISGSVNLFSSWFTMGQTAAQIAPKTPLLPTWLAIEMQITNPVNFVQFDATFNSTNGAEGLFNAYWNTNQIGLIDERASALGLQTYRFPLPGVVSNGIYTLSFRLDTFNGTTSTISVTNLMTGLVGSTGAINLSVSLDSNNRPVVQLAATSNFNYLVQSSTNLRDWRPSALLVNTNGTASFIDTSATNSSLQFYRAFIP